MLALFWARDVDRRPHHRGDLPGRRRRPDDPADAGGPGPFRVELHDLPQHRLPRPVRPSSTGPTGTGSASAVAAGYALDPVCGMQVQTANAPASAVARRASPSTSARTTAGVASRPIRSSTPRRPRRSPSEAPITTWCRRVARTGRCPVHGRSTRRYGVAPRPGVRDDGRPRPRRRAPRPRGHRRLVLLPGLCRHVRRRPGRPISGSMPPADRPAGPDPATARAGPPRR